VFNLLKSLHFHSCLRSVTRTAGRDYEMVFTQRTRMALVVIVVHLLVPTEPIESKALVWFVVVPVVAVQ
jgi:hypothetical protein